MLDHLKKLTLPPKFRTKTAKRWFVAGVVLIGLMVVWGIVSARLANRLQLAYQAQSSPVWYDRNGQLLDIKPNPQGNYDQFLPKVPPRLGSLLLKKEDRFFYWHFGINPFSLTRDFFRG